MTNRDKATGAMLHRRGRPNAQTARKKAEGIIAAAIEAFCRDGYRAVTMRHIAEQADVSTRTLYNHYADKFSLFEACLEAGSSAFPLLDPDPAADPETALREFTVVLVKMLSTETSQSLGMLVHREGAEFPELIEASERNQQQYLVDPIAAFLRHHGLSDGDSQATAEILLAMMISGWHRRVSFRHPRATDEEIEEQAARVVRLFLRGAADRTGQ